MSQEIGVLPMNELMKMDIDAKRYRWLRARDSESHIQVLVYEGGRRVQRVFDDLDYVIDQARLDQEREKDGGSTKFGVGS